MLIIGFNRKRFAATFRERQAEWGLSFALLMWGSFVLTSPGLFIDRSYFAPLQHMMAQAKWGTLATGVGAVRLLMLAINGGWRPSAGWRAAGCAAGCLCWGALTFGAFSVGWRSPAAGVYLSLYALDFLSGCFAARDFVRASYVHA